MILVSKNKIKLITSLQQKKYRTKLGLFVAEGPKVINELLAAGFLLDSIYATENEGVEVGSVQIVSEKELEKISFLKNANTMLAIFKIPKLVPIKDSGLIVVLDSIRDPGNLGTIIRLCDWFGVSQLVCSKDTVDCYNPKVIQATMGSIARVSILYTSLSDYLLNKKTPIFATCMNGENIYKKNLPENAIVILGNEANGISKEIRMLSTSKLAIPQFGIAKKTESLNVATATAILLSEFKRSTEL